MAKNTVPQMVSGLGIAMSLITKLCDALNARGGREEMLHFLTTEMGQPNLEKVAELIASLPWRVPMSVVRRMARECALESDPEYASTDENFFWEPALQKLKIPYIRFVAADGGYDFGLDDHRVDELIVQLHGKPLASGMVITWADEQHVVTSFSYDSPGMEQLKPGDIIDMRTVGFIHLTPIQYIDINR